MTGDGLFVYGTLKRGECNHPQIEPFLRDVIRRCYVFGDLYDAGAYPALVTPGTRKIHGQLLIAHSLAELLRVTDAIEGSEYERVLVEVHQEMTGPPVHLAWVYRSMRDIRAMRCLGSGEWRGTSL